MFIRRMKRSLAKIFFCWDETINEEISSPWIVYENGLRSKYDQFVRGLASDQFNSLKLSFSRVIKTWG